jgi:hypothetical protein
VPTYDMRCDACGKGERLFKRNPPADGAPCVSRVDPTNPMRLLPEGCEGAMKRVWSAPAIGRGSSGEPFRPS